MSSNEPSEIEERPQSRREWSGWLRSLVLPLGLVVAIVGGLLVYQSRSAPDGGDSRFGSVELPADRNATGKSPAGERGRAAPDFLLETLDGAEFRLSDFRGRPLLVNFWATWCTSCRHEMPDFVAAYEKHGGHKGSDFLVIGVNQREADERVRAFVQDFEMSFPVVMDRRGEVARTWRIGGPNQGLPSTYFIDATGVIRKVVLGLVRPQDLEEGLALILRPGR
jgi:peroxiredoxin